MAYLDKETGLTKLGSGSGGSGGGGNGTDIVPGEITDDGKFQMIDTADDGTYFEGEPEDVDVFYSLPKGFDPESPADPSEIPAPDHSYSAVKLAPDEYVPMGDRIFGDLRSFCVLLDYYMSGAVTTRTLIAAADTTPRIRLYDDNIFLNLKIGNSTFRATHTGQMTNGGLIFCAFSASRKKVYIAVKDWPADVFDVPDEDLPEGYGEDGLPGYLGGYPGEIIDTHGELRIGPIKIWDNLDLSERQFRRFAKTLTTYAEEAATDAEG